jgi:hypothetical protein
MANDKNAATTGAEPGSQGISADPSGPQDKRDRGEARVDYLFRQLAAAGTEASAGAELRHFVVAYRRGSGA